MAKIFCSIFFLVSVAASISQEPSRIMIDKERYGDLLENPYARRILGVIFHVGYGHGAYRFTEEEYTEMRWFDEQGPKAFPVLLEVLKREPTPVAEPNSITAWHALSRSRLILGWISHFPEGDFWPFVEVVRVQILRLKGLQNKDYLQSNFFREAFDLLAREGDESDILLMEQFLDDEDVGNRDNSRASIAKLKARLAAEKALKENSPELEPSKFTSAASDASIAAPDAKSSPATLYSYESLPFWAALVCATLLLGGIVWYWKSKGPRMRKNQT